MNGHDDEAWLDTLLQRQPPSELADDDFQRQLLRRLPPRERPVLRALGLLVIWMVGLAVLMMLSGETVVASAAAETGSLVVPFSLGTALLWYVADRLL
jgi:ferric-dicitrate binding protein FerR (iron transport regulator)